MITLVLVFVLATALLIPIGLVYGQLSIDATLTQDPNKYRNPLTPANEFLEISLDNKTLDYEILRESRVFIPRESSIYWTADLKLNVSETKTEIHDLFLIVNIKEIEEVPYINRPSETYDSYWGIGKLTIGDNVWNVEALYEPLGVYGNLRVISN